MATIIFPRSSFTAASSGSGQTFANYSTLSKLATDSSGNLTFNGKSVASTSSEVAYTAVLSPQNISVAAIALPNDCDTSQSITVSLQGLAFFQGADWQIIEHTYPELDLISWQGLGLHNVAQPGDNILITYYKKS